MKNRKVNLLFIHPYKHSVGPNVVLLNLIKYLSKEKFNFFCIFPIKKKFTEELKNSPKIFFLSDISFMPRKYNPLFIIMYFFKQFKVLIAVKKIIKDNKIDIIHVSTVAYWPIGLVAKICNIKCVFHAQDLTSMKPRIVGLIVAFFLNIFADKIICVSRAVANNWRLAGVSVKKLSVIYNGIDLERFKILPENEYKYLKTDLKLENKYPIIGMIAGMDPRKGHRYFIEAMVQIRKVFPDSFFILTGSLAFPEYSKYFETIKKMISKFKLENNLIFLGEREDIPQIINLCDLMVVPSETEAGPFIVLEIQACGKPLVATRVGGLPEYLENGKTGLLVSPCDADELSEAIINLLQESNQSFSLKGREGRNFVQNFRIQEKIKLIENLYLELLN